MFILSQNFLLIYSFVFIYLINTITLAQPNFIYHYCESAANYTINSAYQRNLDTSLSLLPTTNSGFGFYNLSTGQGNNTVNSVALCRGDVNPDVCRSCLNDSIVNLRQLCPNQKEAIGYYDYCLLKYSNEKILENTGFKFYLPMYNRQNSTNIPQFNDDLRPLMVKLREGAAAGGSLRKFAAGNTTGPDFATIYALVQCTPDLSEMQCSNCLENAINQIPRFFNGSVGGRILLPMCNFRYEIYRFFNESTMIIPPSPPPIPQPPSPAIAQPSRPPPDVEMNPKIADFGMARLFKPEETQGDTSRIVGTYGYMAPEYAMHGQFSVKSDVFSFGVLVLEMVTGQKNQCFQNGESIEDLLSFAWKSWRNGSTSDMIDPILKTGSGSSRDIIRSIHIGLLCVQENVIDRPTMASVVLMLNSFSLTLPMPSEPAFFMHSNIDPEMPILRRV